MSENPNIVPESQNYAGTIVAGSIEPSGPVTAALQTISAITHEHVSVQPNRQLADIVHDFAGDLINDALPQVAMMTMLGNRLGDRITCTNAKRALSEYRNYVDNDTYEYATGILSDFPIINKYVDTQLEKWTDPNAEADKALRDALDRHVHSPVERRLWHATPGLPPLDKLLALVEDVNLESILIKAAEALQVLNDPNTPDDELLRTAFVVESTYAPLCEIIGLDAFAATLLSKAYTIRLVHSGSEDSVKVAQEIINGFGTLEERKALLLSLPELLIGESDKEPVIQHASGHDTCFAEALSHIDHEDIKDLVRVQMRIKTTGSLARKIERGGRKPADIMGMTVITKAPEEVVPAFVTFIDRLQQMENVQFVAAPSRDQALHAKGSQPFIESIAKSFNDPDNDLIDMKVLESGFEVAKATFEIQHVDDKGETHILPLEVQFMHELSRRESRTGMDAHTLFKYFKLSNTDRDSPEYKESLKKAVHHLNKIHDRKAYMHPNDLALNGVSKERGAKLRREVVNSHLDFKSVFGKKAASAAGIIFSKHRR